jgi:hypothetical protein
MITVLRAHGLQFAIYKDDHAPPHVHVYGDGQAKILLVGESGMPQLARAGTMKKSDLRRAMKAVLQNRERLLMIWSEIHG